MVKPQTDFRKQVFKALALKTITKVEAKECLKRGFGGEELPLFFDFADEKSDSLKNYILGLEKMGFINPLFR